MKAYLPDEHAANKDKRIRARRLVVEENKAFTDAFEVMVLWVLHICFGFGAARLERFYARFVREVRELARRYEMGVDFVGEYKLRELGIDIAEWREKYADRGGD